MAISDDFLAEILGPPGEALACSLKGTQIGDYLPARAALAWINQTINASGFIPGTKIGYSLTKSSSGWRGQIGEYSFADSPGVHVAAALSVFLGVAPGQPDLRQIDLARLGRTVDLLVKSQQKRGAAGGSSVAAAHQDATPAVAPIPPGGEADAVADRDKAAKARKIALPIKPKLPKIRISKSEAARPCHTCKVLLFTSGKFTGCKCFSKSVTTATTPLGYELEFGAGWVMSTISELLSVIKTQS
jgi:hypothetical protein